MLRLDLIFSAGLRVVAAFAQGAASTPSVVTPTAFEDLAYPAEAIEQRLMGVVVLELDSNANGRVERAIALAGPEILANAALSNIRTWTISPGVKGGVVVYRFEIDGGRCVDDSRGLFRLVHPNYAVVTTCTKLGRGPARWDGPDFRYVTRGTSPVYPSIARNARVRGIVVLDLRVGENGQIEPRVLSGSPLLAPTAIAHARQWRVQPVAARRFIEVYEFALDNHDCVVESNSVFWVSIPGHVVLSGCPPLINASGRK